jgi:hypothetical protein
MSNQNNRFHKYIGLLHEAKTTLDYALLGAYETKGFLQASDEEGDPDKRARIMDARLKLDASQVQARLLEIYDKIDRIKFPEPQPY